eukprot:204585-Prorocentrum_minimum.AAC.1
MLAPLLRLAPDPGICSRTAQDAQLRTMAGPPVASRASGVPHDWVGRAPLAAPYLSGLARPLPRLLL